MPPVTAPLTRAHRLCLLLCCSLSPIVAEAQAARPASATTTVSIPWGDTPLVLRVRGTTRWVWVDDSYLTPVGPDSGVLTVTPGVSLKEEEDPTPTCAEAMDNPPDGPRPVPTHPAVPNGGAWHGTVLDINEMAIACFGLKEGRVVFEIRGATRASLAGARPALAAFAEAAAARWNTSTRSPE